MVKPGKWLKSLLFGKGGKEKEKCSNKASASAADATVSQNSLPVPKEKKRWSFCRSRNPRKDLNCSETNGCVLVRRNLDPEDDNKKNAVSVKAASTETKMPPNIVVSSETEAVDVAAAIKIQAVFRGYLARKALCALKGLVKLQALVRGHLVRKHATDTLRRMQALIAVQARAREQRIKMLKAQSGSQWHSQMGKSSWLPCYDELNEMGSSTEETIKIVEVDHGDLKRGNSNSYSQNQTNERHHHAGVHVRTPTKFINVREYASPTQSVLTDMSPRTFSELLEEFSFTKAENQNHGNIQHRTTTDEGSSLAEAHHDPILFPSYMANTESSRAKLRSQSAPKQRTAETFEKQPSRRRVSIEGRTIPRSSRMQRSISSTTNGYYSNSIKLDRSNTSFVSSECGSTSTVLTNTRY